MKDLCLYILKTNTFVQLEIEWAGPEIPGGSEKQHQHKWPQCVQMLMAESKDGKEKEFRYRKTLHKNRLNDSTRKMVPKEK